MSIIVLVKRRDKDWRNYYYVEYKDGKPIRKMNYKQVNELRKTNIVVIV